MPYAKLRGVIREKFSTQEAFARSVGMSRSALNLKLNNKVDWSLSEIRRVCQALGISPREVHEYFF